MKNRISQVRKEVGLTQSDLAKACGWSTSRIAMYEIEQRTPDIEAAKIVVKTLNKYRREYGRIYTLDYIFCMYN